MLGHSLPPSEMKSLYGSITRSAVISFSYVTFAMLPPGLYSHPSRAAGSYCDFRCQRSRHPAEKIAHLSRQETVALRDFDSADVRFGSFATDRYAAGSRACPLCS